MWLHDGEKLEDEFTRFDIEYMNVTDGQTPHDGIGSVYA